MYFQILNKIEFGKLLKNHNTFSLPPPKEIAAVQALGMQTDIFVC